MKRSSSPLVRRKLQPADKSGKKPPEFGGRLCPEHVDLTCSASPSFSSVFPGQRLWSCCQHPDRTGCGAAPAETRPGAAAAAHPAGDSGPTALCLFVF